MSEPSVTVHREGTRKSVKLWQGAGLTLMALSFGSCALQMAYQGVWLFVGSMVLLGVGRVLRWWHHA